MKIDAQREFVIGGRQNKHQTWQQGDNCKALVIIFLGY
jgi:hypothetical protein